MEGGQDPLDRAEAPFSLLESNRGRRFGWFPYVAIALIPVSLVLVFYLLYGPSAVPAVLGATAVEIRDQLYPDHFPYREIRADSIRAFDLLREPGLQPSVREHGVAARNYGAGQYRLQDGEDAIAFFTDQPSAVTFWSTARQIRVVITLPQAPEFAQALRERVAAVQAN